MREQVTRNRGKRAFVLFIGMVAMTLSAFAFVSIPKESAKALGSTRSKPFSAGAVFINGKYIERPYVVERWGTGIRINGNPVTGQVIDWNEFLKTQANVKVLKQEPVDQSPADAKSVTPPPPPQNEDANLLDDLFDDNPKPKKPVAVRKPEAAAPKSKQAVVTYSMEGEFVPNDTTKTLLAKINARRTEIDRTIRAGGFICFGDTYSQVTGDSRTLLNLLEKLPEFQKNAQDEQDFCDRVRGAGLIYLNEVLRIDLYRNRADYRKLRDLRAKLKKDGEMQKMLNEVSTPLF